MRDRVDQNFMNDWLYPTCESNLKECVLFFGEKRINGNMFSSDFIKMLCTPIMTVCKWPIYIEWAAKWKGKHLQFIGFSDESEQMALCFILSLQTCCVT